VRGDETLKASLVSRSGARWGTFFGGLAVAAIGLAVAFSGKTQQCTQVVTGFDSLTGQILYSPSCEEAYPNAAVGGALLGLGLAGGLLFPLMIPDRASVAPVAR